MKLRLVCGIVLLAFSCTPLLVTAQPDDTEAALRHQAEAEAEARKQAESEAQAAVDSEIAEAEAAAAEAATEAEPETQEEPPTQPDAPEKTPELEASAEAEAAAQRAMQEKAAEQDFKEKAKNELAEKDLRAKEAAAEKAAKAEESRARHAAESGSEALADIAQETQLALDGEEPSYLDFGDILLQHALAAAEAAGMSAEHRDHMMSDERGISEAKRRIMRTNHSAHETCSYQCSAPGTVPVADSMHNASVFADGCGAPGLKVNVDFPFSKCCHSHDICYSTCNTNKNRCDLDFIFCMNSTCNYVAPNDQCRHAAVTLFDGTVGESEGACGTYLGAQGKACNCVSQKQDL